MVRRRTPEKRREKHHNRRQRQGMRNQLQPPADGYKPNHRRSEGRGAAQPTARNQPDANITAYQKIYQAETADEFHMEQYDFIIDAIDSLKDKADLILRATALPKEITFISSMGAALRTDPFMVRKSEFWKVDGDPLARALRKKFKKNKTFPRRKFQCVYSEEKPMQNQGVNKACGTADAYARKPNSLAERGVPILPYMMLRATSNW